MTQKDYERSRDMSWKILIEEEVNQLPVKVNEICSARGIVLASYQEDNGLISYFGLDDHKVNNDGFCTIISGRAYVFFNNQCQKGRIRFTIAHELGHLFLGHVGKYTLVNREPQSDDNPIEQEANVFASRILAPACVLWGLGVENAEQIARVCNISKQAAVYRMERFKILCERDRFFTSPLECEVYAQFLTYIRRHRKTWWRKL